MVQLCAILVFFSGVWSESHNWTVVLQPPESESVQPGDSVTLQCIVHTETCAGEHSVYWFRQGSGESPPGIIYTHGTRSDECQRSSGAVSPTQSCIYNFPKRNLSLSDAGTYYCAVATCGEILFGNGTKLDMEGETKESFFIIVIIPCVALALSLIVNIALLCTWRKRTGCEHCTGNTPQTSQHDKTHDSREQCSSEDALNYAALSFSEKNTKTRPKKRERRQDPIYSDSCVYNFPKRNLSLSDAGTYYCAVATCGEILFGNGSKLDFKGQRLRPLALRTSAGDAAADPRGPAASPCPGDREIVDECV
ncbi:hypothetical protein SKAU_G00366850 [Synaphobranchus kaupii]|uniref:Ig-like domain-containing protein n=1 Tax=Synaphobranchus kaupii TaxID=118154 RepID=A0A9Q1EFA1_SYNKA|nr:hypothetical protein SKAU_G00366850 [Synaphobranchus kaupii]